jgi:hypothetical protein
MFSHQKQKPRAEDGQQSPPCFVYFEGTLEVSENIKNSLIEINESDLESFVEGKQ